VSLSRVNLDTHLVLKTFDLLLNLHRADVSDGGEDKPTNRL